MKKAAWIVVVALVLVAGLAYAKWIGRYYCSYCDFDDPYATGETLAFIEGPVNQTNKDGWVDKNQNPNTVTICNGTKCATFIYVKGSVLWQFVGYFYSTWKPPAGAPGVPVGGGPLPPPPPDGGTTIPSCHIRSVYVCVEVDGGGDRCEWQRFVDC